MIYVDIEKHPFILAKLVHRNSYLEGYLRDFMGLELGCDKVMMPIHKYQQPYS